MAYTKTGKSQDDYSTMSKEEKKKASNSILWGTVGLASVLAGIVITGISGGIAAPIGVTLISLGAGLAGWSSAVSSSSDTAYSNQEQKRIEKMSEHDYEASLNKDMAEAHAKIAEFYGDSNHYEFKTFVDDAYRKKSRPFRNGGSISVQRIC